MERERERERENQPLSDPGSGEDTQEKCVHRAAGRDSTATEASGMCLCFLQTSLHNHAGLPFGDWTYPPLTDTYVDHFLPGTPAAQLSCSVRGGRALE